MALTTCPECSGLLSDTAQTCPHCGAPILKCSGCGQVLPASAQQCPHCGALCTYSYERDTNSTSNGARGAKQKHRTAYIWLVITAIMFVILSATRPTTDDHRRAANECITQAVSELRDSLGIETGMDYLVAMVVDKVTETVVTHHLNVKSYLILSIGTIRLDGKEHVATIGVLNHVFCFVKTEDLKEVIMEWKQEKEDSVDSFFDSLKRIFTF